MLLSFQVIKFMAEFCCSFTINYFIQDEKLSDKMKRDVLVLVIVVLSSCQYPWVRHPELNRGLPASVAIYTLQTDSSPFGTKLTGGFVRFNMNDPNLEFVVKDTNGDALGYYPKTPLQYAQQEQNLVYAVINGGFFDMHQNTSSSFLAQNYQVKSNNTVNEAEDRHPTVGAFGLTQYGKFEAEYIYSFGQDMKTYKFQHPNPFPGPVISPELGTEWKVKEGIGAGPILIKNYSIIDGNPQHFNQDNNIDFRNPRSAICVDKTNHLYFVVIDGRYSESEGMKIPEMAHLMQSLKCKEALNLDGGGSTCLVANNQVINRPSDPAGPRKVVSVVLIRDRRKKKFELSSA